MADHRFAFRFDPTYRRLALPFGVRPSTAVVRVSDEQLDARFGPWRVRTPLANVAGTQRTGPYTLPKTAGPAHLSLADRGITFATNGDAGLCIGFHEPVTGIDPFRLIRHPGLTVTVADLDGLEQLLDA
ncbi:hypothetical protein NHL50_13815 [Acidimicrobiia bacterium EGI L10123]|uniref:hypothetical protein n=1 Tax=Salinilacustrithrix flava TaxID=2957203 RepID=UPI003D7C26D2|nr:hypothetical protein [Acidimicrobiia bacterium EGI L10123]